MVLSHASIFFCINIKKMGGKSYLFTSLFIFIFYIKLKVKSCSTRGETLQQEKWCKVQALIDWTSPIHKVQHKLQIVIHEIVCAYYMPKSHTGLPSFTRLANSLCKITCNLQILRHLCNIQLTQSHCLFHPNSESTKAFVHIQI